MLAVLSCMTDEGLDQSVTVKLDGEYLPAFEFNLEMDSEGVLDDPHFVLFMEEQ